MTKGRSLGLCISEREIVSTCTLLNIHTDLDHMTTNLSPGNCKDVRSSLQSNFRGLAEGTNTLVFSERGIRRIFGVCGPLRPSPKLCYN
eukprot:1932839-Amphidinium_carterae.1